MHRLTVFFSMPISALMLVSAAPRPDDAEAYRLDRIETQKLNNAQRAAIADMPAKAKSTVTPQKHAKTDREQTLRMQEERALEAWRSDRAACRAGDRKSCTGI